VFEEQMMPLILSGRGFSRQ